MKKKTPKNNEKKRTPAPKFTTTKNLSTSGKWLEIRFNDLIKIIKRKKRVAKDTGKFTLTLDKAEFESIIDGLERGKKNGFILDENKKLHVEINNLDTKLDDKAWNELIAIEWAKKAIPETGAEKKDYKEAVFRLGVEKPKRGRPREHDPSKEIEFWNMTLKLMKEKNNSTTPSTEQRRNIVTLVQEKFGHHSYDAAYQYLLDNGAKTLPWQNKA